MEYITLNENEILYRAYPQRGNQFRTVRNAFSMKVGLVERLLVLRNQRR